MDFDYKKYSLEQLNNWVHDAMTSGGASPKEIYDEILSVVKENYYIYKKQVSEAYELLTLLNSNSFNEELKGVEKLWDKEDVNAILKEKEYYEPSMPPWGHSDMEALHYTEEELNAMCDKAESDQEKEKCREYNLREAEYYDKRAKLDTSYDTMIAAGYTMTDDGFWIPPHEKKDKVVKWRLPVEVDSSGEYFLTFPDDLLKAANFQEGDTIEWVDTGNSSYTLRKVTKFLRMDEC